MVNAKKIVRKVAPKKLLGIIESEFRLARASYANARFNWPAKGMRVIMITGTNGKTTTAHYLFSILRTAGYSVGMLSTAELKVNDRSQINDTNMTSVEPILLRKYLSEFRSAEVDFVILEATSQALDQHRLFGIPCEVAIMTNFTQDHLDYHETMDRYAEAKAKLWKLNPKITVLNKDDDWFSYFKSVAQKAKSSIISYGEKADVTVTDYKATKNGALFSLGLSDGSSVINNNLTGIYNAYNAGAAAAAAAALKIKGGDIEEGIEELKSIPGRLEAVKTNTPYKIIVDYAHTPDGLDKVLGAARESMGNKGKLWLVFGSCGDRDRAKRPLMGSVAALSADRIVLTDEESYYEDPQQIRDEIMKGITKTPGGLQKTKEIADRKNAIEHALGEAGDEDLILITGLGHEQYRIIDGKRVRWNDTEVVSQLLGK